MERVDDQPQKPSTPTQRIVSQEGTGKEAVQPVVDAEGSAVEALATHP